MDGSLFGIFLLSSALGFSIFRMITDFSHSNSWVDAPDLRRRHAETTPLTGGIGVLIVFFLGVALFCWQKPAWLAEHARSVWVLGTALTGIAILGFLDDLKGLGPYLKLGVECALALFVLLLEPNIHAVCLHFQAHLPEALNFLIWPLGVLWIVGSANAINLIDGIDGLAGVVGIMMITTAVGLHYLSGFTNSFMPVMLVLCMPGLLHFVRSNWYPAGIFLGNNGSLALGFMIACGAIAAIPEKNIVTHVASLTVLMAYPILDMGLCVFRRRLKGYSIFKADRCHLHHRIQRLGLTAPQTTTLLLFVNAYMQICSLLIQIASPLVIALITLTSAISLMMLLYLVRCVEYFKSEAILQKNQSFTGFAAIPVEATNYDIKSVIRVDITPLLEVGMQEEKKDVDELLSCLSFLLRRTLQSGDRLVLSKQSVHVYLPKNAGQAYRKITEQRVRERLQFFQKVFQIQYSLDGLPVDVHSASEAPIYS